MRRSLFIAILLLAAALGAVRAFGADNTGGAYVPPPDDPPAYSNPVMAGDFPDPTAVRIGPEYWAVATHASGQPSPPILRSPDLVHWEVAGYLYTSAPSWSTGTQVWGPWIDRVGDSYHVYYSARRKRGRPCVTVGVGDNPIGPYTDAGPLVCQANASIDPSVVRNQHDTPFLVWKENGGDNPSSIWVQQLTADGLGLIGSPRKILFGNRHNWEGGLVEGPRIIRRHQYLYLFYSGGACCLPPNCRYALGVARATSIFGPWRRYRKNPLVRSTRQWKCPGHGAILQTPSGHWWLVYNAAPANGPPSQGRSMLLDIVRWSRDGWPVITPGYRAGS